VRTDEQSDILLAVGKLELAAIHHRPLTFTRGRQPEGRRGCQLYPSIRTSAASGRAGAKLNSSVFFCFSCPVATARAGASSLKMQNSNAAYAPALQHNEIRMIYADLNYPILEGNFPHDATLFRVL